MRGWPIRSKLLTPPLNAALHRLRSLLPTRTAPAERAAAPHSTTPPASPIHQAQRVQCERATDLAHPAQSAERAASRHPTAPSNNPGTANRSRRHEAQLRRSAEFLEFAQNAGGFGVLDLDLITGHISGTSLFFELIGLSGRDLTLTRDEWLATVHPEDLEGVVQELNAAIACGGKYQAEYRTLALDGAVRWLAGRGQVLMDAEGYPARAIGTVTDITQRKQLEDKLRRTTESLHIAQTAAGVATFDLDIGHDSFISSGNFHELLGLPLWTQLRDLNGHRQRVHPDDAQRIARAPFDTTWENPAYHCEYRVLLDGGAERWLGEKAQVSRSKSGEVNRITGAIVDITDLKRTEAAAAAANRAKSAFLANVSHEIRTPMNGVIGMAQILSETTLDNTQRDYVDIIRGSAKALLSVINDVLDLSKIEADRLELESIDFDLR
ncbi:MAG TPA: PAS domain-containing protein, partial [Steroidobacteraceae bacterium]